MEKIKVLSINRFSSYVELQVIFTLELPVSLVGVPNKDSVAKSYDGRYGSVTVDGIDYFTFTTILTAQNEDSLDAIKAKLIANYEGTKLSLEAFAIKDYDVLLGVTFNGTDWV